MLRKGLVICGVLVEVGVGSGGGGVRGGGLTNQIINERKQQKEKIAGIEIGLAMIALDQNIYNSGSRHLQNNIILKLNYVKSDVNNNLPPPPNPLRCLLQTHCLASQPRRHFSINSKLLQNKIFDPRTNRSSFTNDFYESSYTIQCHPFFEHHL